MTVQMFRPVWLAPPIARMDWVILMTRSFRRYTRTRTHPHPWRVASVVSSVRVGIAVFLLVQVELVHGLRLVFAGGRASSVVSFVWTVLWNERCRILRQLAGVGVVDVPFGPLCASDLGVHGGVVLSDGRSASCGGVGSLFPHPGPGPSSGVHAGSRFRARPFGVGASARVGTGCFAFSRGAPRGAVHRRFGVSPSSPFHLLWATGVEEGGRYVRAS